MQDYGLMVKVKDAWLKELSEAKAESNPIEYRLCRDFTKQTRKFKAR